MDVANNLQQVLRDLDTVWSKEQVSKVRHICGLLENAPETEASKAEDEEPRAPLSSGLSFRGFLCVESVGIFKAPRPR